MCDPPGIIHANKAGNVLVLALEVQSSTGYVKIPLLFRERLSLWYYPGDITHIMNAYQLRSLWTDIHLTPPEKVMASVLEAVTNYQPMGLKRSREEPIFERKRRR